MEVQAGAGRSGKLTYTQFKAMRQRQAAYNQRAPTPHVPLITSPYSFAASASAPPYDQLAAATSPSTVRSLTPSPVAPPAARTGAWASRALPAPLPREKFVQVTLGVQLWGEGQAI